MFPLLNKIARKLFVHVSPHLHARRQFKKELLVSESIFLNPTTVEEMRTRRIFQTTRTKNINETAEGRKKKKKKRNTGIQEGIKKEDVLRDERRLCRHLYIFVIPLSRKG